MVYKDRVSTDLQTSVILFADYFCTVYNSDQNIPVPSFSDLSPITDLGSIDIYESEVISAMRLLDNNASPDRDNICNLVLKNCCAFLGLPLRTIFLESLNSSLFLDRWKFSTITPIFKSGHKHEIDNYRGITKLMVVPKLFEAIKTKIYEKIRNSISPYQHGFVAGRSTSTNLVLFINYLINSIEKGSQIDVVYTDFSKAFDRVIISHLIQKLAALGFHSTLLLWIGSYLSNRFQVVQIGKFTSYRFKSSSGVPQGSHLGPVLYILMINDLPLLFKPGQLLMYADDVKLYRVIKSTVDSVRLQSDINVFIDWCSLNGFSLNALLFHSTVARTRLSRNIIYKTTLYLRFS